ncbi:Y-family DNA polymerase [Luteibacter sahnii]|uniref:Y-family DNA polymerase n=1 Tax=Luteibacter sahnii TaxID=3021977 RepID=UPI002A6A90A3|nr:DNA polymerase Y family protein [Luteibacter sp. PPL193]MDY1549560.1 DNA polymerase Y family protein [Luteibacter sp. PPL193]
MLWACILLPSLALDGVLRRQPDSGPVVLVDGPAQTRTVVAANAEAKAAGLRVGQRLSAAQALLAQFTALPYDPTEVERWQTFLAGVAYRYSSEVALLPHALVLEVGRSRGLFGEWSDIERRLRGDLTDLGFRHRLAAAPSPHAAYVLAGVHDGLAVAHPEHLRRALEPVPLRKARLPAAASTALPRMGVRTLGQLLRMPRDGLRRRFGAELLDALDQLLGDRPAGLDLYAPPDAVDWRLELSHEVENIAALVFPVRRMTADLAAYLAGRDGGVQRFVLHLEYREGATEVAVGLLAPERAAHTLFDAARGRLEQVRLPAPVLALRLRADDLPPFVPEGRDLFDERPAHALPFGQLRERLRARLGDDAVYQLATTRDPRPERSQRVGAQDEGDAEASPRPTWLLERPIPWRGAAPTVVAGPERMETGWWDGGPVRRDYYIVETAQGQRAWAFLPPDEAQGWMLHGWFA